MTIKAIQTFYKGYHFRSRLEARWAVFFEEQLNGGVAHQWQYEVEGFELLTGRYLPDFYFPGSYSFVEIKPSPVPKELTKEQIFAWELSITKNCQVMIAYGDPFACLNETDGGGWIGFLNGEKIKKYDEDDLDIDRYAMLAARQARFEFGQSGAAK